MMLLYLMLGPCIYSTGSFNLDIAYDESFSSIPVSFAACYWKVTLTREIHDFCETWDPFIYLNQTLLIWDPDVCKYDMNGSFFTYSPSFVSMIFSLLLLSFNFLTRVMKLYEPLSTFFKKSIRRTASEKYSNFLEKRKTPVGFLRFIKSERLWTGIVYQPLLALHLLCRLYLDIYISMLSEV